MKTQLATVCLLIGASLSPVATLAEDRDSDQTHPETYASDSAITAKVKAKLAEVSSLAPIRVDTDNWGAVVLSGTVRSQTNDHYCKRVEKPGTSLDNDMVFSPARGTSQR